MVIGVNLSGSSGENPGVRIIGRTRDDQAGFSVSGAGDVNGDGFDDIIVGAPFATTNGRGESYVIFGRSDGFDGLLNLDVFGGPDVAQFGMRLHLPINGTSFGQAVSGAGDLNGDGFDDLLIGQTRSFGGEAYVVFGNAAFGGSLDVGRLTGSDGDNPGLRIGSVAGADSTGAALAGIGDTDGDGFDDLLIGAPTAFIEPRDKPGAAYLIEGRSGSDFDAGVALDSLTGGAGGSPGGRFLGAEDGDQAGASVAGAGDVNGDGFDDFLIGAPGLNDDVPNDPGRTYLIYGRPAGFDSDTNLSDFTDSEGNSLGTEFSSYTPFGGALGSSVAGAGDINGDGFDDLIIGASRVVSAANATNNPNGIQAAETYVVFGRGGGLGESLDLENLSGSDGANPGLRIRGENQADAAGWSVSGAGDVNGDGYADILIGAPYADFQFNPIEEGASYLIFGRPSGFDSTLDVENLTGFTGDNPGIRINGVASSFARSGLSVSGAGDVNGDGLDDILIGAPTAQGGSTDFRAVQAGEAHLIFGRSAGPSTMISGADRLFRDDDEYRIEINQADGTAGEALGWDLMLVEGDIDFSLLTDGGFLLDVFSRENVSDANGSYASGPTAAFDPALDYSFEIMRAEGVIRGFQASDFELDLSGFANDFTGSWGVEQAGQSLWLTYSASGNSGGESEESSAVPLPASLPLLLLGAWLLNRKRCNPDPA